MTTHPAELVVETVPVDSLVEWPGNPRRGNIALIAESLATHGQYRPVLVQQSTGRIIAGNHTWKGAQKLGWATIQVVRLDGDDERARRILLIDNRTSAPLAEAGGAHMLLTDPPYGIAYKGAATGVERAAIAGDATGSEAADLVGSVLEVLPLRPGALSYVFTATGADGVLVQAELVRRGLMRQGLVWAKQAPTLTRSDYQQQHELIVEGGLLPAEDWPEHESLAYGWVPGASHRRVVDRRHRTVLHFDRPSSSHDHPTMKPVPLLQHLIAAHKLPAGSIVAEPFGGSGSTLVACQLEGLVSYVVEFEPAYCDVILDRWRDGTGEEPVEVFW